MFFGDRGRSLDTRGFNAVELADRPADHVPLHTHDDAHFVVILRGQYLTSAAGLDGRCGSSSVLFNPAGTTHRDRFTAPGGRFLCVSVRQDQLALLHDTLALPSRASKVADRNALFFATRIREELRVADAPAAVIIEGLALEMIGTLVRGDRIRGAPPQWLRRAHAMITDCCTDPPAIADIAAEAGVHPYHLARMFRRYYHATPGGYARRCRLERATDLLRHSNLTISEIAMRCGYADQSQFTRSCRRHLGTTPGAIRQR
jgi:AraC family transcriptional regulator